MTFRMTDVVDQIKSIYAKLLRKNLCIFKVPNKDLRSYTTREKDAVLDISRMPLRKFRDKSERLLEDNVSSDEDEEEKELFDEFVIVDKDEAKKIDEYLRQFNKPELLR